MLIKLNVQVALFRKHTVLHQNPLAEVAFIAAVTAILSWPVREALTWLVNKECGAKMLCVDCFHAVRRSSPSIWALADMIPATLQGSVVNIGG